MLFFKSSNRRSRGNWRALFADGMVMFWLLFGTLGLVLAVVLAYLRLRRGTL
jgi:hypothetical protein